jgi:hypothetical protein
MHECAELGIQHVWMHWGPGGSSVSDAATAYGREHGITVIDGGCPLMLGPRPISGTRSSGAFSLGAFPSRCDSSRRIGDPE